ncbi:hypothetical protein EDC04DRAFT_2790948 [Pisolithus marmoratus]|nr:hypothetical protein EDC04DRAFT_2790948 [Pisolithus marmoratus]
MFRVFSVPRTRIMLTTPFYWVFFSLTSQSRVISGPNKSCREDITLRQHRRTDPPTHCVPLAVGSSLQCTIPKRHSSSDIAQHTVAMRWWQDRGMFNVDDFQTSRQVPNTSGTEA